MDKTGDTKEKQKRAVVTVKSEQDMLTIHVDATPLGVGIDYASISSVVLKELVMRGVGAQLRSDLNNARYDALKKGRTFGVDDYKVSAKSLIKDIADGTYKAFAIERKVKDSVNASKLFAALIAQGMSEQDATAFVARLR